MKNLEVIKCRTEDGRFLRNIFESVEDLLLIDNNHQTNILAPTRKKFTNRSFKDRNTVDLSYRFKNVKKLTIDSSTLYYLNDRFNNYWKNLIMLYPNVTELCLYLGPLSEFKVTKFPITIDISRLTNAINSTTNKIEKLTVIKKLDAKITEKVDTTGMFEVEIDRFTTIDKILTNWDL